MNHAKQQQLINNGRQRLRDQEYADPSTLRRITAQIRKARTADHAGRRNRRLLGD